VKPNFHAAGISRASASAGWAANLLLIAGLASATSPVYPNAEAAQPLQPGASVPSVSVRAVDGSTVDLSKLVSKSGALLVFYRGGWWPYCDTQLGELRKIEDELTKLGFPVVAISADQPAKLEESRKANNLGYTLYSDSSLTAARALGIAFQLNDEEVQMYLEYGIDLEAASGQKHHQLPVPSVFLVEAGGTIRWVYSNPDYEIRPDNAAILKEARGLAKTNEN
jgi:peroxiredoxin